MLNLIWSIRSTSKITENLFDFLTIERTNFRIHQLRKHQKFMYCCYILIYFAFSSSQHILIWLAEAESL